VALPVVLLGIAWSKRALNPREVVRTIPFFAIALVMGLVTIWFQNHHALSADFPQRDLLTRVAGVGWAMWFYVWKAMLPVGLVPIYPQFAIDAHSAVAFGPLVLLVAVGVVLLVQEKRWGRTPLLLFGGFVLMLLPVAGLLNVNYHKFSLVADHWQYFALPFATAAIACLVERFIGMPELRKGALGVAVVAFIILANQYAQVFGGERIWRATLGKNPTCWIAANNLGDELEEKGRYDEALDLFNRALKDHPGYRNAMMGIASTNLRLNKMPEAIAALLPLVKEEPNNLILRFNLGSAYLLNKQPTLAAEHLEALLALPAADPLKRSEWRIKGMSDAAMRVEARLRLGNALASLGRKDEALKNYMAVLEADPDSARAHYQVASILGEKHDRVGARKHLRDVIRLSPEALDALNDLAWNIATDAQATTVDKAEAKQCAGRAAELTRNQEPGILDTLAAAYAATGDFDGAVTVAKEAQAGARAKGDAAFVADLQKRIDLYSRKQPYTE
jgi:tetratricopeptide (TPR) repeat protein